MNKFRITKFLLLAAISFAAASAHAQTATDAAQPPSAEELAALQAQIPILEAQAKIAKLKAEISRAEAGTQPSPSLAAPFAQQEAPAATTALPNAQPSSEDREEKIRVLSVSGYDGHFDATLTVDGRRVLVQPGDALEGGWKVAGITDTSVTLVRGKKTRVLRV